MPESAREFVRAMQETVGVRSPPSADAVAACTSRFSLAPDRGIFNYGDHACHLLQLIAPGLPPRVGDLVDGGTVAVGEIMNDAANASMTHVGDAEYAIILNSGLSQFIYRVARPLAGAMDWHRSLPRRKSIAAPELARIIAEIFWWYQETGIAYGPTYPIENEDILLASALATNGEAFLLAHELGHVYAAQDCAWREGCDTDSARKREEHIADAVGILTLMKATQQRQGPDHLALPTAFAGAELVLQIWRLMESLGMQFVDGTHPLTSSRIENIRSTVRERCATDEDFVALISLASELESVFDCVEGILHDPSEHAAAYERGATEITKALQDLIKRCTGGMWPDYGSFYAEFAILLSRGYPQVLLERVVANTVQEFKEANRQLRDARLGQSTRHRSNAERALVLHWNARFQSFKLFYGLGEFVGGPVAEMFASALGRELIDHIGQE